MKQISLFTLILLFASSLVAQKGIPEIFHHSNKQVNPAFFKTTSQDGMIKMDSTVQKMDLGEGFVEYFIGRYFYNDNGQLIQTLEHEADFETGEMNPSNNYYYYYDGENMVAELEYEWDTAINDWYYDDSIRYTYTGGLLTQEDYYWYDAANTEWDHDFITYYYYTANFLDSVIETQWNGVDYDPNEIIKYSYEAGQVSEELIQYWNGSQWVNDDKYVYTWDGDNLTEYVEMNYDETLSQWINLYQYTYTWETNGNLNEEIDYEWNADLEQWEEMMKLDGTYDNTVAFEDMILPFSGDEEGNPLLFFAHKIDSVTMYQFETVKDWAPMLKMSFHYSDFVGIFESTEDSQNQLTIYPNPAKDEITVITSLEKPTKGYIRDASGRIITSVYLHQTKTINIDNLTPGIYFLHVNSTSNSVNAQKFIVQ